VPPDFSLESDIIRPKARVESDLSFFICIIQKQEPLMQAHLAPPWRQARGSHSVLGRFPFTGAPGKLPRKAFREKVSLASQEESSQDCLKENSYLFS
jgi:hypothetical protein